MKKSKYKYKELPPMGELTDSIHINVDEIPDHVRDELATATLDFMRRLLSNPETREMLKARTEERKKRLSDKEIFAGQGIDHGTEAVDP